MFIHNSRLSRRTNEVTGKVTQQSSRSAAGSTPQTRLFLCGNYHSAAGPQNTILNIGCLGPKGSLQWGGGWRQGPTEVRQQALEFSPQPRDLLVPPWWLAGQRQQHVGHAWHRGGPHAQGCHPDGRTAGGLLIPQGYPQGGGLGMAWGFFFVYGF